MRGKQIINGKFREEERGWYSRGVRGGYGVGLWKTIRNEWKGVRSKSRFIVGNGKRVKF